MNKALWIALIAGQILSAGNMNYQQEAGYYEINPIYGQHPDRGRIYCTKLVELGLVYGATKLMPRHKTAILAGSNLVCWGFIFDDRMKGISFGMRW